MPGRRGCSTCRPSSRYVVKPYEHHGMLRHIDLIVVCRPRVMVTVMSGPRRSRVPQGWRRNSRGWRSACNLRMPRQKFKLIAMAIAMTIVMVMVMVMVMQRLERRRWSILQGLFMQPSSSANMAIMMPHRSPWHYYLDQNNFCPTRLACRTKIFDDDSQFIVVNGPHCGLNIHDYCHEIHDKIEASGGKIISKK
jgi:hypothetical protein